MLDYQIKADNWKEQYESLQLEMEVLEESKCTLEQQLRVMASELAVEKASSNQAGKDKNLLETSFFEQLSKASEEIRGLRVLLNEEEFYAGELVQTLTQTQEDLCVSSDKVRFWKVHLPLSNLLMMLLWPRRKNSKMRLTNGKGIMKLLRTKLLLK